VKLRFLPVLLVLISFLPLASAANYEGYYWREEDGEDDIIYMRLWPPGVYRGRQYEDMDISSAEARYKNGSIEFVMRVYGKIDTSGKFRYYFDVDTNQTHEGGYDHPYDLVIGYYDGEGYIEYQSNWTQIDITNHTIIDGRTLRMNISVDLFHGYDIKEVQAYTLKARLVGTKIYSDSTEPIEEDVKKDPMALIAVIVIVTILGFLGLVIYMTNKRKIKSLFRRFAKKQCPNCEVIYSRRMECCTYCGAELK
jgi:hypothetical protein